MSEYIIWRAIKFLGLVLLSGGVFAATLSTAAPNRMRGLVLTSLGLVLTWAAGYMMMHSTGMRITEPWILAAVGMSLVSLFSTADLAHAATKRWRRLRAGVAAGGIFAAVLVMIFHSAEPWVSALLIGISLALAVPLMFAFLDDRADITAPEARSTWDWFKWIARAEGVTLILLVLVNLPLKRFAGLSLDGGTGLLGWVHGTLFFLYIQGLWNSGNALQWSWLQRAVGFALSLIPFGTFVFEYLRRKDVDAR